MFHLKHNILNARSDMLALQIYLILCVFCYFLQIDYISCFGGPVVFLYVDGHGALRMAGCCFSFPNIFEFIQQFIKREKNFIGSCACTIGV